MCIHEWRNPVQPAGSPDASAARDLAADRATGLRSAAADLLAMADALEVEAGLVPLLARQPLVPCNDLTDKVALLDRTAQDYINRRQRRRYLSAELFGEPAWDLLLDLFQARLDDKMITVTSACIAADVPLTTALRWLGVLEQQGLVERTRNVIDQRSTWVRLTDSGMAAMIQYTEGCMVRARRAERLSKQGH